MKDPITVVITGAAGQIGYSLIPLFVGGEVLGDDQPIILHLLDVEFAAKGLEAVAMELVDGAYPLLVDVVATTNPAEGFKGVDVAVLLGGFPRLQGMTRADLLSKNCDIFKLQGAALGEHANPNCKVVVVANPANTNCLIAYNSCNGKIPAKNFTCLTRLDQNRAVGQIAKQLKVGVSSVAHVVIWGNHSQDQYPDMNHATVTTKGNTQKATEALAGDAKFVEEFIPCVQTRGAKVIATRGKSSAMSAANATKDHLHSWLVGTKEGEWASMGVVTDGTQYGVPAGLVFSLPTTCKGGEWTVVEGLPVSEDARTRLDLNVSKLQEEYALGMNQ